MMRYKVKSLPPKYEYSGWKTREAFVILRAARLDQQTDVEFEGDEALIDQIKQVLSLSAGIGGYTIKERTTPRDLAVAMHNKRMQLFQPELVEGADMPG